MENFSANVLLDVLLLCFISIGIALPLYQYIRQIHPELAWNYHGNVRTSSFDKLDLLGIFIVGLLYSLQLIPSGNDTDLAASKMAEMSNISIFLSGLIGQLIPVFITCAFLIPRMNVSEVFGLSRPRLKRIIVTAIIGLFGAYILILVSTLATTPFLESNLGKPELQKPVQMILEAKENNPALLIVLAVLVTIVAPLCEEFVFRGYIYGTLKRFSCRFFAATVSALLFATVHNSLWAFLPLFILGLCLAIIYEISGSLWTAILAHAIFNSISTVGLIFFHTA